MSRVPYHPNYVFSSDEESDAEYEMAERPKRLQLQKELEESECSSHASTISDIMEVGVTRQPQTDGDDMIDFARMSKDELSFLQKLYKEHIYGGNKVEKAPKIIQLPRDHPVFDGSSANLESWIMEMELTHQAFTNMYVKDSNQKPFISQLVPYFSPGSAVQSWFKLYASERVKKNLKMTWNKLIRDLRKNFGKFDQPEQIFEDFYMLQQEGSVKEYITKKNSLAVMCMGDLNENVKYYGFVRGLKPRIREYVKLQQPKSVEVAQDLAIAFENSLIKPIGRVNSDGPHQATRPARDRVPKERVDRDQRNINGKRTGGNMSKNKEKLLDEIRKLRANRCFDCGEQGHRREECHATDELKQSFQKKIQKLKLMMNQWRGRDSDDNDDNKFCFEHFINPSLESTFPEEIRTYNLCMKTDQAAVTLPIKLFDIEGRAFIDSGCSFNAISSKFAASSGIRIIEGNVDIKCIIGGGNVITLKKREATGLFDLFHLGEISIDVLIMDPIPGECDAIFGLQFLKHVNPDIDWITGTLAPKDFESQDKTSKNSVLEEINHLTQVFHHNQVYFMKQGQETRVISTKELEDDVEQIGPGDCNTFSFLLRTCEPELTKSQRFNEQSWDALKDNPAFEVLLKYRDSVFKEKLTANELPENPEIEHTIELVDLKPITVKQFRLSPDQQQAVETWTKDMLHAGLIRPSTSPYSSPIFCVKKPVGWRIVHDYRLLNSITRVPQQPIPRKEEILDAMYGGYWFSCMDLLSGYYQLLLKESDREFTAFSTPLGHFEYLVTAQGLAGAPATFNRFIQGVFSDLQQYSRAFF